MVGTALWGWLGRWWPLSKLVALGFFLGAVLITLFSFLLSANFLSVTTLWAVLFFIGVTLMGSYANLYTVALTVYPAQIRSTGLGWGAGLGRAGAVLSPFLAGIMMAGGVSMAAMFLYFVIPVLVASACLRFVHMAELP